MTSLIIVFDLPETPRPVVALDTNEVTILLLFLNFFFLRDFQSTILLSLNFAFCLSPIIAECFSHYLCYSPCPLNCAFLDSLFISKRVFANTFS